MPYTNKVPDRRLVILWDTVTARGSPNTPPKNATSYLLRLDEMSLSRGCLRSKVWTATQNLEVPYTYSVHILSAISRRQCVTTCNNSGSNAHDGQSHRVLGIMQPR